MNPATFEWVDRHRDTGEYSLADPKHFPGDRVHYSGSLGEGDGTVLSTHRMNAEDHAYRLRMDCGWIVTATASNLTALEVSRG